MNQKTLNIIRLAAQYWIPAFGTLVFTLGSIWDWSWVGNAVGSIMAFDTFLGALVGFGTRKGAPGRYDLPGGYDGEMQINTSDPMKDTYTLDLGRNLAGLESRSQVVLKVVTDAAGKEPQE
jgi:hypothetical protein